MKNTTLFLAAFLMVAGTAVADTLTVTAAAAMGGTNFGMEVFHDNSSLTEVRDDSPSSETVYRSEFLFNAQTVNTVQNYRQLIFQGTGPNPQPGVGACPVGAVFATTFRIFHNTFGPGGGGQVSSLVMWANGNQCGQLGVPGHIIQRNTEYRVCMEWITGQALSGTAALAVVLAANPCPASGDPAYNSRQVSNGFMSTDFIELGTPRTNFIGANETSTLYFDEFASFRTLAP